MLREPYTGPVVSLSEQLQTLAVGKDDAGATGGDGANGRNGRATGDLKNLRPPTSCGGRNLQDSSFALSGECLPFTYLTVVTDSKHFVQSRLVSFFAA